jgi:hypothetical protein
MPGDFTPWLAEEANLAQLLRGWASTSSSLRLPRRTLGRSEPTSSARIQAWMVEEEVAAYLRQMKGLWLLRFLHS